MTTTHHLEYLPSCGGVGWVIGLCKCSRIKVEAYVDWGLGRLLVWLDGDLVINESAVVGHTVTKEVVVSPSKFCGRITVGVNDPSTLAISNIKVDYWCEDTEPVYYLEYLPPSGGIGFSVGVCSCTWIKVEAFVGPGTLLRVLLDGEIVIEDYAPMEAVVYGETDVSPPIPCSQITVGIWGSSPFISGIRVWYMCEAVDGEADYETVKGGDYW